MHIYISYLQNQHLKAGLLSAHAGQLEGTKERLIVGAVITL